MVSDATRPLGDFERFETERMAVIIREALTAKKIAERQAEQAQAAASKATGAEAVGATAEAISAANAAAAIMVPAAPRLLADDCTPEALTSLLADSEYSRIAVLSDEGGIFEMMAGRYSASSKGPNLDIYLKAHVGTDKRVDRKGRPPEYVQRPALSIGLAIQPQVLQSLARMPGFRGRGLIGRFLYALPRSLVGHRHVDAIPVPDRIRECYETGMQALVRGLLREAEHARMVNGKLVLEFTGAATAAMREFERAVEPQLDGVTGRLGSIQDWGGKLVGAAIRMAGLLHIAECVSDGQFYWEEEVVLGTVEASLEIAQYLIPHALAVYDLMGADLAVSDAQYILDWIIRTGTKEFTRRDLITALPRGRFGRVEALDAPLGVLEGHGYIRQRPAPRPRGRGGRPPSPTYDVNPAVHQCE